MNKNLIIPICATWNQTPTKELNKVDEIFRKLFDFNIENNLWIGVPMDDLDFWMSFTSLGF